MANKAQRMMMKAAGLTVFVGYQICQNRWIRNQVIEVFYEDLPEELIDYRIVHISDLHGAVFGKKNHRLIESISSMEPDVLCITGDMLHYKDDSGRAFLDLIDGLDPLMKKLYVSGNHENARRSAIGYEDLDRRKLYGLLEDRGVILLNGTSHEVTDLPIVFAGTFDRHEDYSGLNYIEENFHPGDHLPMPDRSKFQVALVHRPNYFRSISDYGYQLMLSGHIHGGVIRIGRHHGLLSPEIRFFPEFSKGLYRRQRSYLHVTSGLGMGKPLPRIANRTEVVLLILKKGKRENPNIPEVTDPV